MPPGTHFVHVLLHSVPHRTPQIFCGQSAWPADKCFKTETKQNSGYEDGRQQILCSTIPRATAEYSLRNDALRLSSCLAATSVLLSIVEDPEPSRKRRFAAKCLWLLPISPHPPKFPNTQISGLIYRELRLSDIRECLSANRHLLLATFLWSQQHGYHNTHDTLTLWRRNFRLNFSTSCI